MPPAAPPESDPLPGIAVKLTPEGHQKHLASPDYIPDLIRKADAELGLVPRVSPLIDSRSTESLAQTEELVAQRDPTYQKVGFETWYQIRFTPSSNTPAPGLEGSDDLEIPPKLVELARKLRENATVITTQFLHAGPPPSDGGKNPDRGEQGYLNAAPLGIDAKAAWDIKGGDGSDIRIIDIEQGWNLNHEDLAAAGITLEFGTNKTYRPHGTKTLGVMLMVDNTLGGLGISYKARGRVVSQWQADKFNTPAAISAAIDRSSPGDFILIEAQEVDPVSGLGLWPVEIGDANFDLITLATKKGVTVIEPASNGSRNLDEYVSINGEHIFKRGTTGFRESGAVMVGSAGSDVPHVRRPRSNFGTRVDVFAWGVNVFTTSTNDAGTDNHLYTNNFTGTSSASAIVAGAAMNVQGIVKARFGRPWDPDKIRATLQIHGTPSANPATDLIGVMPDLKEIVKTISEIKTTAVSESFVGKLDQKSQVTVQEKLIDS